MNKLKVLQLCAVDFTVKNLLLPLVNKMSNEGFEVHILCSDGPEVKGLRARGYQIKTVDILRSISPLSHFISFIKIVRYMREEHFDIVHVHTPIASILGRIAARVARVHLIIYTAHGFYFHDDMPVWKRKIIIIIEKLVGRLCTDLIFTQSHEDMQTAIKEGIIDKKRVYHIGNGVDIEKFKLGNIAVHADQKKKEFSITSSDKVIGFIGRIVKEKGIIDLILAFKNIANELPNVKLLLIGDNRAKDRDLTAKNEILTLVDKYGLQEKIIFAGHRTDINELLMIMDVFVLPSYREGMPRSIIEAMVIGKPVVATNIRGCREEVIDGDTGSLVPVRNPARLSEAILNILKNEKIANQMARNGKIRAYQEFDEEKVLQKQVNIINQWR
jgi:glycosyltransferase involved in cell wall biosynthesis